MQIRSNGSVVHVRQQFSNGPSRPAANSFNCIPTPLDKCSLIARYAINIENSALNLCPVLQSQLLLSVIITFKSPSIEKHVYNKLKSVLCVCEDYISQTKRVRKFFFNKNKSLENKLFICWTLIIIVNDYYF